MQIYTKYIAGEDVLFLVAEDKYETAILKRVGQLNEPLIAHLRLSPIFKETFLEIRKEQK